MKKLLIILLLAALFPCPNFAQDKESLQATIAKIEKEVKRLEGRLAEVEGEAKVNQILDLIDGQEARLGKLKKQLEEMEKPKVEEAVVEELPPPAEEVIVQPEKVPELEEGTQMPERRFNFQIGGNAGIFGGTTAILGELRVPLPFIFGPATSALRLSGGLAQSEDLNRRYAPLQVEGVLNFPAGWFTGVENYVGGGVNYVVRTSGGKSGIFGASLFYGVESDGFGGKMFGEMGYAALRTGFSPTEKGTTVMVGYRRNWGF